MRPYQVKFHLYAESDDEVADLQRALYDLVSNLYDEGILLTARKLTQLVSTPGAIAMIKNLVR